MSKQDKKPAKEASNIFHNIMKASVTLKKEEKVKKNKPESKPKQ